VEPKGQQMWCTDTRTSPSIKTIWWAFPPHALKRPGTRGYNKSKRTTQHSYIHHSLKLVCYLLSWVCIIEPKSL
jgi:hypothetical protein